MYKRSIGMIVHSLIHLFFFFNDTATTEIYTLSLHDALPISQQHDPQAAHDQGCTGVGEVAEHAQHQQHEGDGRQRSEEHTSELQSHLNLVCRLLLEKKKNHSAK